MRERFPHDGRFRMRGGGLFQELFQNKSFVVVKWFFPFLITQLSLQV